MSEAPNAHVVKELTLETLPELAHGKLGKAFARESKRMIRDCIDRPGDDRLRTLTVTLAFKPIAVVDGQCVTCEGAKAIAKIRGKSPDYETQEIDLGVRENGSAVFSPTCPENHRQMAMFDEPDELK